MKTNTTTRIAGALALVAGVSIGFGQGTFRNLGFEEATIISVSDDPYYQHFVYSTNAIPGWTAYIDGIPQIMVG